jgi:hypothetical protein
MGQDSAPYNRTESTNLPYIRVFVQVKISLVHQDFAASCTAVPATAGRQLVSFLRLQSALKELPK